MNYQVQLWIAGDKGPAQVWESVVLGSYPNTMPEHVKRNIIPYVYWLKDQSIRELIVQRPKSDYIVRIVRDDREPIEKMGWLKPH